MCACERVYQKKIGGLSRVGVLDGPPILAILKAGLESIEELNEKIYTSRFNRRLLVFQASYSFSFRAIEENQTPILLNASRS